MENNQTPPPHKPEPQKKEMSDIGKFLFDTAKIHQEIYRAGMKQDIFDSTRKSILNHIKPNDEK